MFNICNIVLVYVVLYLPLNDAVTPACLGNLTQRETRTPTLYTYHPFHPELDANVLRTAMYGLGTDEAAIINILARRTKQQRLAIADKYQQEYGKNLVKDLKGETSGDFKRLLVAMMTPPAEYYAEALRTAMNGADTDEDALIEILCTKPTHEIVAIKRTYRAVYGTAVEEDLVSLTSGTAQRLMVSLCHVCRNENDVVDEAAAKVDAAKIAQIGLLNLGIDQNALNNILYQRNENQIQQIFKEYEALTGHNIDSVLRNEFAISRTITHQAAFFARFLRSCMEGVTTRDRTLMRLIVTRSEIDMAEIKKVYEDKYGESLADSIRSDTSGDYETCLLTLIGENK